MTAPDPGGIAHDPGEIFTRAGSVNVDADLAGDYSAQAAVEQARAAMRGEAEWTPLLTAPAILAAAVTAELQDIRARLDDLDPRGRSPEVPPA